MGAMGNPSGSRQEVRGTASPSTGPARRDDCDRTLHASPPTIFDSCPVVPKAPGTSLAHVAVRSAGPPASLGTGRVGCVVEDPPPDSASLQVVSDPRETALAAVEVFCESRVPDEHRDEIQLECERRGNTITIVERRAPWNPALIGSDWTSLKIAQLRFDPPSQRWSLHWCDSSERWFPYEQLGASAAVDALLGEIEADPTGIFWG